MEPWGFEPQIPPCHGGVIPFHYGPGVRFLRPACENSNAAHPSVKPHTVVYNRAVDNRAIIPG